MPAELIISSYSLTLKSCINRKYYLHLTDKGVIEIMQIYTFGQTMSRSPIISQRKVLNFDSLVAEWYDRHLDRMLQVISQDGEGL